MAYHQSAENLYDQMKINITNVDTSENSYVYNSLFPSAMEISNSLLSLDEAEKKAFASTAVVNGYSKYLEKRVSEMGITRKTATYAKIEVSFTGKVGTVIDKGSVVSTNDNRLYTTISNATIGINGIVTCYVLADTSGSLYNVKAGDICYLPIKYSGVTSVINPNDYAEAYDDETDEDLYNRYLLKVRTPATSGNVYQYEQWCLNVTGVGGVKVYPLKDENLVTKNGHVTCVITDSNKQSASESLIETVKNYIDPNDGTGEGQAPIGATVHIRTVTNVTLDIVANVSIDSNQTNLDTVKSTFSSLVDTYLNETVFNTKIVILKKIEALLMGITGVNDCSNLLINGLEQNITLSPLELAVLGTVTLNII